MNAPAPSPRHDPLEAEARRKYSGGFYQPDTIMRPDPSQEYFSRLHAIKMRIVRAYAREKRVLDLCCATGNHLFEIRDAVADGTGLDFSLPFLEHARAAQKERGGDRLHFLCGNARCLPFAEETFGLVYSFSSLYCIPRVREILPEIARVLEPDGIAVLEFGNLYSLNTLVARAHPETAAPCHLPIGEMRRALRAAGLAVLEQRAFQILPLWGNKPRWLRPFLGRRAQRMLGKMVAGKMLDERLCRLPILSRFAFRRLFVCRKA